MRSNPQKHLKYFFIGQSVEKKRIAIRTLMSQDETLPSFRAGNCHYSHKGDSGAEDMASKEGSKESSGYLR